MSATPNRNVAFIGAPNTPAARAEWASGKIGHRMFRDSGNPGPNAANTGAITLTRARVRQALRDSPLAVRAVTCLANNIVGSGIVPRIENEGFAELWRVWDDACDADGISDMPGMIERAVVAWLEGGESFVRIRPRRMSDGLPVPMQLQLLEAEMLPLIDQRAPNGNEIYQGIEVNAVGERVAYWFHRSHPGDYHHRRGAGTSTADLTRVPAEQVCHLYEPTRPGQLRGFPMLATVLPRLQALHDFDLATIERQKQASHITMVITRPTPETKGIDPVTGEPIEGREESEIKPGSAYTLLPGEDLKMPDLPSVGSDYEAFTRVQHRAVAAGVSIPYELLTGDFSTINDRTSRIAINEFRRRVEQHQWHRVIRQMLRPIWLAFVSTSKMARLVPDSASDAVRWVPPSWPYIHPVQDIEAQVLEVRAGFRSRLDVIHARGLDPKEVNTELVQDRDWARENDLVLSTDVASPAESAEAKRAQEAEDRAEARAQAVFQAELRAREVQEREAQERCALIAAEAERHRAEAEAKTADAKLAKARAKHEAKQRAAEAKLTAEALALIRPS